LDGVIPHLPIDVEAELKNVCQSKDTKRLAVLEEDSEEESDSEAEQEENVNYEECEQDQYSGPARPSDYLQAFTHFTYWFTNRKVLICDLQGIYNTDMSPPTFELTDPAIHYHSKRGRQMVFGRTDKGRRGMDLFFKTHKCTIICKFMQLSRKNKFWRKEWRSRNC